MLIPFLPYLLAVAGLSGVLALPAGDVATPPWALAALYFALPLLGAIIGELPRRLAGPDAHGQLRRRILYLAAWLGLLATLPLAAELRSAFAWSGTGETAALVLLLINFWVGDTLVVSPLQAWPEAGWPAQLRRFGQSLRVPLPILLLVLVSLALPSLADDVLAVAAPGGWSGAWLRLLGSLGGMLVMAAVAVPVLIRICWGLRPLADGPAARAVHEELAANGARVGAVLLWPEALLGHATAGVVGLLPPFRYLLVSPSLLTNLDLTELRAVTAHEAGHIRQRHLWYFFAAILAFIMVMQGAATAMVWAGLLGGAMPPLWLLVGLEVAALLVFFRFGMGYVSRHFERQADGHALRRQGAGAFEGALRKVGLLNGIPAELDNWHHYGIGRRIRYAQEAQAEPEHLLRHDRKVGRIKLALLGLLVLSIAIQAASSSPLAMDWLGERYLAQRLSGETDPSAADLVPLQLLALRAVQREDHAAAERYFRLVLRITPEDAQARNNLAWVLVTRPGPRLEELREGLALARDAAQAEPQAYIWDTLAESYYRLQQYEEAVDAASRALLLAEEGTGRGEVPISYYRERLAAFSRRGAGA